MRGTSERRESAKEGKWKTMSGGEFDPLSRRVIGAAIEVHRRLGPGFREEIYETALCMELAKRDIPCRRQVTFPVRYDGRLLGDHTLDLVVDQMIVVELKAVIALADVHVAQVTAYLRASGLQTGLLLNFGEYPLGIRRVVNHFVSPILDAVSMP